MTNPVQLTLRLGRRYPGVEVEEQRIIMTICAHWKKQVKTQQTRLRPIEQLEAAASKKGLTVAYVDLPPHEVQPYKALYAGNIKGTMAKSIILLPSSASQGEQAEILAEELAHHQLSRGNILDQKNLSNRKQEKLARELAYRHILPPEKISEALSLGYQTVAEIGEYTGLRPLFVQVVMESYQQKNLLPPCLESLCAGSDLN